MAVVYPGWFFAMGRKCCFLGIRRQDHQINRPSPTFVEVQNASVRLTGLVLGHRSCFKC